MIKPTYTLTWLNSALKGISKIPKPERKKLIKKVEELQQGSRIPDLKKLKSSKNLYRIRYGNYRIIFQLNKTKQKIILAAAGHRKDVYQAVKALMKILES